MKYKRKSLLVYVYDQQDSLSRRFKSLISTGIYHTQYGIGVKFQTFTQEGNTDGEAQGKMREMLQEGAREKA
jgi:archaeosine-15-forming tRNA-guanine transglycosylase